MAISLRGGTNKMRAILYIVVGIIIGAIAVAGWIYYNLFEWATGEGRERRKNGR